MHALRLGAPLILGSLLILSLPFGAHAADTDLSFRVSKITMTPKPPTCEVRATKRVIRSGGAVDIVWKSKDAVTMTGLVKGAPEWPTKGRQRVAIAVPGKHEFPMTFIGKSGATTTCTAKVFVRTKKQ